ncbi:MAG: prolipoprotein diacylglyceryl transferase [bacterium]
MFLHSYHPNPVFLQIGPIRIYWYSFFIVLGIITAFIATNWLLSKKQANNAFCEGNIDLTDLSIYLLIGGLFGARFLHVLAEWRVYIVKPLDIFKIWNGGLWIYGAILGGALSVVIFVIKKIKKCSVSETWEKIKCLLDLLAPGIILAQAIGRWGNYFNQELYGLPTNLPWGIPIDTLHKVPEFTNNIFFHPIFLYESLWCGLIGIILLWLNRKKIASIDSSFLKRGSIFLLYLFLYSLGRFFFEFLRIDPVPQFCGIRITQLVAGAVVATSGFFLFKNEYF